jgi:hypothetical protein
VSAGIAERIAYMSAVVPDFPNPTTTARMVSLSTRSRIVAAHARTRERLSFPLG